MAAIVELAPIWLFQLVRESPVLVLRVVTACCVKEQVCMKNPAAFCIWMPMLRKEPLYGGLLIVETARDRLAACGGEAMVRNCCPKLVESEQAKEPLFMVQRGVGLKRLGKVLCRVELMEMMLFAGSASLLI